MSVVTILDIPILPFLATSRVYTAGSVPMNVKIGNDLIVQQFLPLLAILNTIWYHNIVGPTDIAIFALQPKLAMFSSTISAIIGIFNTILSIIGTILDIPILPFLATSEVHTAGQCLVQQFLPLLAIIGNP